MHTLLTVGESRSRVKVLGGRCSEQPACLIITERKRAHAHASEWEFLVSRSQLTAASRDQLFSRFSFELYPTRDNCCYKALQTRTRRPPSFLEAPSSDFSPSPATEFKLNFTQFRQSFSSNVSYLKRRFSSGDLSSEQDDEGQGQMGEGQNSTQQQQPQVGARQVSAPTSPTSSSRTVPTSSSLLQRVQSLTGSVAKEVQSRVESGLQEVQSRVLAAPGTTGTGFRLPKRVDGVLNLLVVDDAGTDWSKYFSPHSSTSSIRLTVHQAPFSQLQVLSSTEFGTVCILEGSGQQFQPDFVLIRQNLRDGPRDWRNLLIGLMYGGVGAVNSLQSIYNFQDKSWVFAQLLLANRTASLKFPLIEQIYYASSKEMGTVVGRLPAIVKIGHAHGGLGKLKVGGVGEYQDATSLVALTGHYCTCEPYIEARCNIYIQKIGSYYKAFMRKGIVGHWKSSARSAMLEQVPMQERYKIWIDSVSTLFGGLDICGIEIVVGRDNREYIIEVNDSALKLFGESQEEDRRAIAELVISRIQSMPASGGPVGAGERYLYRRMSSVDQGGQEEQSYGGVAERRESSSGGRQQPPSTASTTAASTTTNRNPFQSQDSTGNPPPAATGEGEDTMKNLRKTFAGIFGDM